MVLPFADIKKNKYNTEVKLDIAVAIDAPFTPMSKPIIKTRSRIILTETAINDAFLEIFGALSFLIKLPQNIPKNKNGIPVSCQNI